MIRAPWTGDATSLEDDLRRSVRGEVRFDAGHRALYATDASNYRQVPIGVVAPLDEEDLVAAVAACRRHGAPVVQRGGWLGSAPARCSTTCGARPSGTGSPSAPTPPLTAGARSAV